MELLIFLALLTLGFFVGARIEKQHYQDLESRESKLKHVPLFNLSASQMLPYAQESQLFVGTVVVSSDYFKTFAGWVLSLFGGNLSVYESLLERGRREALLRMKEDAIAWGAVQILNVHLETSSMNDESSANAGTVALEVIAYGTAIR
jgi:uncharacterized protein YbjQ (UPF0145 family)